MLTLPATTRTLLLASLYPFRSLALHDYAPQFTLTSYYATMASADSDAQAREGGKPMLARHRQQNDEAADIKSQTAARNSYFPLSYKDGVAQWWAGLSPAVTEHRVLSFIPYLRQPPTQTQTGGPKNGSSMSVDKSSENQADPVKTDSEDPYGPRMWHSDLVQLSGKNRFLNEFSVERLNEKTENSLVMLHGYGAGLGFYYKNFESLSRLPHWKLYALDMPGMGRSSRPPFTIKAKDREGKVWEAESWFVDALEEWRVKRGLEKMTLMGHSLGGYMAVCYALKYPGRLDKLILASPVGIPEDPYAVSEAMPTEAEADSMAKDFANAESESIQAHQQPQQKSAQPPPRRPYSKWLTTLWDANISPFSVVRFAGPLGPRLVSGWTSRRFAHLPAEEAQALHDYSYSLFRQKGSGEYALAYILAPGAFARSPLIRRIQGVGRQYIEPHSEPSVDNADRPANREEVMKVRETGIPVVFYYGDHDWMDVKGGREAVERMGEEKRKALATATDEEKRLENGDVKVRVVKNAGHHVYLDGADEFNKMVAEEMKDVERA
ncbi:hypothetical protein LTR97_005296 [Elasticomyces elasticus]|uniref:AB hydrolase-1 domain-containing protein n=1 Tax=Elasticomyces elasticus TaxID=574655 RepID=A0AAN7W5R5_9PEZI|nr:hypothetical protein LTR97_005296 [Elasticomyces elasticus]